MASPMLCIVLLIFLNIFITLSAQTEKVITAIDSNGKKYSVVAVVSPGQWIKIRCPHIAPLKWSKTGVVNFDSDNNNSELNISNIEFSNAGIYYCEKNAQSLRFFLNVVAITKTVNGTVPITTSVNEINGFNFHQIKINERSSVNVSCFCDFGLNKTKITINWHGGRYDRLSKLYEIVTASVDNGVNSTLVLLKAKNDRTLYGQYNCSCNIASSATKEGRVFMEVPPVFDEHDSSVRTTEGEDVTLTCNVWGYPSVSESSIQWHFQNNSALREGITVAINVSRPGFSQLLIPKVTNADRGVYSCQASNDIGTNTASYMLRVKGRYAALWPFIGIIIQLVILVAIIVVYEWKKSQKSKGDTLRYNIDSNNEADALGTERGNEPESVRQRLVKA